MTGKEEAQRERIATAVLSGFAANSSEYMESIDAVDVVELALHWTDRLMFMLGQGKPR